MMYISAICHIFATTALTCASALTYFQYFRIHRLYSPFLEELIFYITLHVLSLLYILCSSQHSQYIRYIFSFSIYIYRIYIFSLLAIFCLLPTYCRLPCHKSLWCTVQVTIKHFDLTWLNPEPSRGVISFGRTQSQSQSHGPHEELLIRCDWSVGAAGEGVLRADYYRQFIRTFTELTSPLTDLTRKGASDPVQWTQQCQVAFEKVKKALCGELLLFTPNF